jgi:hypothetical protein
VRFRSSVNVLFAELKTLSTSADIAGIERVSIIESPLAELVVRASIPPIKNARIVTPIRVYRIARGILREMIALGLMTLIGVERMLLKS